MKSDAVLNLRVPAEVKEALSKAADDNLRTLSSMAVWALAEYLSQHGYLDREPHRTSGSPRKARR